MTDKVLCPWCGSRMWYKQLDHINGFYECPQCLACGPAGRGEADAKAAALRRYEPPCRPLTEDEVKPGVLKIDEWVEFPNGYVRHCVPRSIECGYMWDSNDCYYDLSTYGTDWRLWPRRPTEQERKAAGWGMRNE